MAPTGRARARDLGIAPGTLPTGPVNAITDVPGIRVGHATIVEGTDLRTGVTAIVPDALLPPSPGAPGGQPARARPLATVPAGLSVFNGFGKMTGSTQLAELGTIETPVLLTGTLSVFRAADALLSYLAERLGPQPPGTLNPVVAETNDGYLSDIWARPVTARHVRAAIDSAASGPVAEGCVGAGTGTGALGFKAGIGTSSRVVQPAGPGRPMTVGALVQANFGGVLTVLGTPVPAAEALPPTARPGPAEPGAADGGNSCVIVLATDAAVGSRQLQRLANRAFAGMARTGSDFAGHSGDYALAIGAARTEDQAGTEAGTAAGRGAAAGASPVPADILDLLFLAAIEATEEAILNSLCKATTTTGYRGHVRHAVPLDYLGTLLSGR